MKRIRTTIGIAIFFASAACSSSNSHGNSGAAGKTDASNDGSADGGATSCTQDSDCNLDDQICGDAGTCVPEPPPVAVSCESDSDCATGETCDTSTGACTAASGTSCQECACQTLLSAGGCADICDEAQNGTSTPNFCNGVSALSQCAQCLTTNCAGIADPTDPSACD